MSTGEFIDHHDVTWSWTATAVLDGDTRKTESHTICFRTHPDSTCTIEMRQELDPGFGKIEDNDNDTARKILRRVSCCSIRFTHEHDIRVQRAKDFLQRADLEQEPTTPGAFSVIRTILRKRAGPVPSERALGDHSPDELVKLVEKV